MAENEDVKTEEIPARTVAGIPPPSGPATPLRVDFGALSHPGKVRSNNEDHFMIVRFGRSMDVVTTNLPDGALPAATREVGYVMAVADGMGGLAAGETASMIALSTGIRLVLESATWYLRIDEQEARDLVARMRVYVQAVDRQVVERAEADRSLAGMGTTLTVAYSVGDEAFVVHAGDSRAYLLRAGILHQLTHDHTVAQSMADAGLIRPDQVPTHARRHVLTNYVGGPPYGIDPECCRLRLADGDQLLLCSDGLTEMLDDSAIAAILRRPAAPGDTCRALVDLALERGGRDNVTVVLARYTAEAPAAGGT